MEVAALIIAILSIIIAMLALGWQVIAWGLNGSRLSVTLLHGVMGRGGPAIGVVGREGKLHDMSLMRVQGWDGPEVLAAEVTNHGRLRAKVTRFSIHLKRGSLSLRNPASYAPSPSLPCWLEPGESGTWYFDIQDAMALGETKRRSLHPDAGGVFLTVETGTGKILRTRRHVEL